MLVKRDDSAPKVLLQASKPGNFSIIIIYGKNSGISLEISHLISDRWKQNPLSLCVEQTIYFESLSLALTPKKIMASRAEIYPPCLSNGFTTHLNPFTILC